MSITGRIIKATGGFYYVNTGKQTISCRARGLFRKQNIIPYVGDIAEIEIENGTGYLTRILQRKNFTIRPPVANIDQVALVISVIDPSPNFLVLDKLIAIAVFKKIAPVIVITKSDLADTTAIEQIYATTNIPVFVVSSETRKGTEAFNDSLAGKVTAFSGNSGVGKSSLLNAIDPRLAIQTGQTSKKLGRGKHTTRHVELYELKNGGFVVDTPGFSSIDIDKFEIILKQDLQYCFTEFTEFAQLCKFKDCSHILESSCAVCRAVEQKQIAKSRHDSYIAMYNDAKNIKEWEH